MRRDHDEKGERAPLADALTFRYYHYSAGAFGAPRFFMHELPGSMAFLEVRQDRARIRLAWYALVVT